MLPFDLKTLISQIGRIGRVTAKRLEKLEIKTTKDLLFYFPFRYDDFSKIVPISQLKAGMQVTIKGRVDVIANKKTPHKRKIITEAIISDESGSLKAIWFNQNFLPRILRPGKIVYLAGKISYDFHGLELINPSYEIVKKDQPIHTARLVPIYPTTQNLTQKQIRYLVRMVIPLAITVKDWLPREIKENYRLSNLPLALEQIHFPASQSLLEKVLHRLKFDELLTIQLQVQLTRLELKKKQAPEIKLDETKTQKFVKSLPFKLTDAQRKSAWEIVKDLEHTQPMNRLLEGDVGSGKTVVACIAMLNTILAGYQSVFMAPTEILARQHFENLKVLYKDFPIKLALLTRTASLSAVANKKGAEKIKKTKLIKDISEGEIDIIIGTHALLQEGIKFKKLGLAIVDEQHRFGVEQRATLSLQSIVGKKGLENYSPHFLSMTATPIPRSLALTLYGDLDLSIIDQMPPGRKKVMIEVVKPKEKNKKYQFIKDEIKMGRQAFIICPLIDPSDKLGVQSVKAEYEKISKSVFPDLKIGLLHGRLKPKEKEKIMERFLAKKIDILISTSVVEVGIDVPNASIMAVEDAERFGLAQLYQLQGRVGRSIHQSYCFLFIESSGEKAKRRLTALMEAKNGFELAEKDLELRGPGEVYGVQQSGFLSGLRLAKLSDVQIIKEAQEAAVHLIKIDPNLDRWPEIWQKIKKLTDGVHLE